VDAGERDETPGGEGGTCVQAKSEQSAEAMKIDAEPISWGMQRR
jgi:hypothetical protein